MKFIEQHPVEFCVVLLLILFFSEEFLALLSGIAGAGLLTAVGL